MELGVVTNVPPWAEFDNEYNLTVTLVIPSLQTDASTNDVSNFRKASCRPDLLEALLTSIDWAEPKFWSGKLGMTVASSEDVSETSVSIYAS
jgi:hypothetical protein